MTGFSDVTKWGQTRDKSSRDVTKFLAHARNRTTTRFVEVWILSHFCPQCDKICHNSLIHQSICHISYNTGIFVMANHYVTQILTNTLCYDIIRIYKIIKEVFYGILTNCWYCCTSINKCRYH